MASSRFVLHTVFDLRREGLVRHDTDETILKQSSRKSQPFTPCDARTIGAIQGEMQDIIDDSSSKFLLTKSNQFRSKWIYTILAYILLCIPLNIFFMLYSTKTNDIILFILSIITLIVTLFIIYKMEYYFNYSVYSFLSWNSNSIILLRNYIQNKFNKNNKFSNHNLKTGISYETKTGLYQFIAHIYNKTEEQKYNNENQSLILSEPIILHYRFNEDYIIPIIYESFDLNDIHIKGIQYYHLWNQFIQELFVIFNKFTEPFDNTNFDSSNNNDIELNNIQIFETVNSRMRIRFVHEYRLNKIRQSTLKQIRRLFIIFGLCLLIGVPLIVNDNIESMTSYKNIATWILIEGILFFVFALLTMPLCCGFYQKYVNCFSWINNLKIHNNNATNQLLIDNENISSVNDIERNESSINGSDLEFIDIKKEENKKILCCGDSNLWIDCIVSEIDDFCHELNSKYTGKYTFKNDTGFYDAPNGEPYTGKITIESVTYD